MKRLAFTVVALVLVLVVLEVAGSLAYRFLMPEEDRQAVEAVIGLSPGQWNSVLRYRAHPYLNYMCNPEYRFKDGVKPHNQIGIRDPGFSPVDKREGVIRLVAIGGSTTYGMYAENGGSVWPALVGMGIAQSAGVEVEVVNAGVMNYTTWEMLGMASMWLPEFQPDLVLIHAGLNDAFTVGYRDEGGPDGRYFRHAWNYREISPLMAGMMRHSRLLRVLGWPVLSRKGFRPGDMAGAVQYPIPGEDETRRFAPSATGKYYRRNLETLVKLVEHAGAVPVLVDMPLNPDFESGKGIYYDSVSRAVVRNNLIMEEIGREAGVPVVKLYDRIRDPVYFLDAAHMNQQGMIIKAQAVFDDLKPRLGLLMQRRAAAGGE